ncbi:MAG: 3'-5' exonuclease, partial [Ruthenibacterium sp.]
VFGAMTNGEQRIANVHAFAEIIAQYEGNGARGLFEFLCYIESLRDQGIELPQPMHCAAEDAVSILSIHASKGLEYPIVFLSDLSRRFNQNDLKASALLHKDLGAGVQVVDKELMYRYPTIARSAIATCVSAETKSEELRILYVAMTRAKQKLVMTFCDKLQSTLQRLVADATMPLALSTAQADPRRIRTATQAYRFCSFALAS